MSVPPIEVRATYDGSDLQSGVLDAEGSIKDLATAVDTAADDINTSLRSMDDGVSSSLSSGGTLDQGTTVASDSMKDMASTAREEVPMAMLDMQDGVAGAAQGISGAMATLGPGGTVVASVISGFVIMKNQADAAAQAMRDKVNAAFSAIEVKARTTNTAIEKLYEKQLNFTATLEEFGDGDATKGYEKLAGWADTLGVETEAIIALIQGKQTPATENLLKLMERQNDTLGVGTEALTEQQQVTANIATAADLEAQARETTLRMSRDNRDYLRDNKEATEGAAAAAERQADAAERGAKATKEAADNAARLADNLTRADRAYDPRTDVGV